jgi:prepilin-type processing-associated H-X9-DG protein
MPIDFTCPHCQAQMNVADQYGGQTGPCAKCGQTITIPYSMTSHGGPPPAPARGSGGGVGVALVVVGVIAVVLFCVGGGAVALLLPAVQAAREAARRSMCMNNMKQIALAMHNYHDVWGVMPPAYIADENGRPMHSWRVLILPYMEGQHIYSQYKFDEPWDGPNNSRLVSLMPPTYACPSNVPASGETHYMVITGEHTMFNGGQGTPLASVSAQDGTANTLLVVEATDGVNWMEPRDLNLDEMSFIINDPAGNAIGSHHPGGANISTADGAVRFISQQIDEKVLRNMIQVDDGETIPIDAVR